MILNWWHQRQRADVRTVDERFTDFADRVSEAMGKWRTSAFCLVLIAIWGAFGPYTGYSDSWQLWVNTPHDDRRIIPGAVHFGCGEPGREAKLAAASTDGAYALAR